MRPSPHQCSTWHRSPRGWQAQVVPVPKALTAAARGAVRASRWMIPLVRPLLKLGVLRLHVVLKVDDSVGTDIHLHARCH
jgi:hypothetical protein